MEEDEIVKGKEGAKESTVAQKRVSDLQTAQRDADGVLQGLTTLGDALNRPLPDLKKVEEEIEAQVCVCVCFVLFVSLVR